MNKPDHYKRNGFISFILRWLPALLMMGIIFFLSSNPSTNLPQFGTFNKIIEVAGHLLGYALLTLSYVHAIGEKDVKSTSLAGILAFIYAVSDEIHQSFVPGRDASFVDLGIDLFGILVALATIHIIQISSADRSFPEF